MGGGVTFWLGCVCCSLCTFEFEIQIFTSFQLLMDVWGDGHENNFDKIDGFMFPSRFDT